MNKKKKKNVTLMNFQYLVKLLLVVEIAEKLKIISLSVENKKLKFLTNHYR